jgi:hypothetical protein
MTLLIKFDYVMYCINQHSHAYNAKHGSMRSELQRVKQINDSISVSQHYMLNNKLGVVVIHNTKSFQKPQHLEVTVNVSMHRADMQTSQALNVPFHVFFVGFTVSTFELNGSPTLQVEHVRRNFRWRNPVGQAVYLESQDTGR